MKCQTCKSLLVFHDASEHDGYTLRSYKCTNEKCGAVYIKQTLHQAGKERVTKKKR